MPHDVEVVRLADLCDIRVKDRTIDFMKIVFEGGELGVLQSGEWERFRPRRLTTVVRLPPNIYDGYETAELAELKRSASGGAALRQQIEALFSRRAFRWVTRLENWPKLEKLAELLRKLEIKH